MRVREEGLKLVSRLPCEADKPLSVNDRVPSQFIEKQVVSRSACETDKPCHLQTADRTPPPWFVKKLIAKKTTNPTRFARAEKAQAVLAALEAFKTLKPRARAAGARKARSAAKRWISKQNKKQAKRAITAYTH